MIVCVKQTLDLLEAAEGKIFCFPTCFPLTEKKIQKLSLGGTVSKYIKLYNLGTKMHHLDMHLLGINKVQTTHHSDTFFQRVVYHLFFLYLTHY